MELWDRRAGLTAALMVTVNATSIEYAQTARSYAMYLALATLSSVFFIRSLKRDSESGQLASYVASATGTVYAQLFGIFALPSQWLSLFLFRPYRRVAIRLTACIVVVGLLSVPAFYFSIFGHHGNQSWIPRTSPHSLSDMLLCLSGAFDGQITVVTGVLAALYILGVMLALLPWPQRDWGARGYLLLSIGVPIGLTIVVSAVKPLFVSRYLLAGLPLFALLAAIGFQRLKPSFALSIVVAISLLSLVEVSAYYRAPAIQDWRGAVEYVAGHAQPGDMLVVYDGGPPVEYYVSHYDHGKTYPAQVIESRVNRNWHPVKELNALFGTGDATPRHRVWLTFATWEGLEDTFVPLVLRHAQVVQELNFSGVKLLLLEKKS